MKKHRFKSIDGAVRRIRELEDQLSTVKKIAIEYDQHRNALAKLAADGPCFLNPLHIMGAKEVRDQLLKRQGLNPDGSFISVGGP